MARAEAREKRLGALVRQSIEILSNTARQHAALVSVVAHAQIASAYASIRQQTHTARQHAALASVVHAKTAAHP